MHILITYSGRVERLRTFSTNRKVFGTLNHINVGQVVDGYQKQKFAYPDVRNRVPLVIQTVSCFGIYKDEGEINEVVDLTKPIVLQHNKVINCEVRTKNEGFRFEITESTICFFLIISRQAKESIREENGIYESADARGSEWKAATPRKCYAFPS